MRPPDAIDGWDGVSNAELYDRFTRQYPFYEHAGRELIQRADLGQDDTVLDLCGGTGIAAAIALELMGPHAQVISVDGSAAMQAIGRQTRPDPRITWTCCAAEDIGTVVKGGLDAVVCSAAIWKTDTTRVFAAAHHLLRRSGRFVFNVGGGFAGLTNPEGDPSSVSLNSLIHLIAERDYGYQPQPPPTLSRPPILNEPLLRERLKSAGFTTVSAEVTTWRGSVGEKRAWLSIPLFSRPAELTYAQRMEILEKAYQEVDKNRPTITRWLVITAQA